VVPVAVLRLAEGVQTTGTRTPGASRLTAACSSLAEASVAAVLLLLQGMRVRVRLPPAAQPATACRSRSVADAHG
jgi:hypothetical protein